MAREREMAALIERIALAFPAEPAAEVPPGYLNDPFGVDEGKVFVGARWDAVPTEGYAANGYDVTPAIWFSLDAQAGAPEFWNYYLPGHMTASLQEPPDLEISFYFILTLFKVLPRHQRPVPAVPWWGGQVPYERFTEQQIQCVRDFIAIMKREEMGLGRELAQMEAAWRSFSTL